MLSPALLLLAACCRAARLIRASHDLQLDTGLLLAVPIPASAAAEGAVIQQAIQESLQEADARGVAGAEVRQTDRVGCPARQTVQTAHTA